MIRGDSHTIEIIIALMDFHQPPSCETKQKTAEYFLEIIL
jgi:hypothetical protein